ncbi:amidohydrolase family protein [Citricoccus sp. GCM10030269]|uniref:amidohydrolase family protein n=1 Tax=Citricoccus sp. GCM10030269 TaxID=3273388 RepID=UPI003611253E
MTTLYVNGTIHSTADPYATAMLVDGDSVAWVGADDTAEAMRVRSGSQWDVVDLDSALMVPAFVDSLAADSGSASAARGVFLSVGSAGDAGPAAPEDEPQSELQSEPRSHTVGYRSVGTDDLASGLQGVLSELRSGVRTSDRSSDGRSSEAQYSAGLAAVVGTGELDSAATARLADEATAAGVQVYFLPQDPDAFAAVIAAVEGAADAQGKAALGMARHRVSWNGPVDGDSIRVLAEHSLSVTVVPEPEGDTLAVRAPVASLLAGGVPVAFGSGGLAADLWAVLRASLEHADPEQRISARAGFTAATRAGLRALPASLGDRFSMAGRIAPSSPATFGIWAADALSVQAPDGRVAAWSTDTRAGTPLLPVLEEGTAAPRCLATVVDGQTVYRAPEWT